MLVEDGDPAPGCRVLSYTQGDVRRDYHVDPGKDFRSVKEVWWTEAPDGWKKEEEYVESDFVRLPGGQWYARKRKLVPHQGPVSPRVDLVHMDVLDPSEIPPERFSGEEVLKGVKQVERR